jgi:hypothetical protein
MFVPCTNNVVNFRFLKEISLKPLSSCLEILTLRKVQNFTILCIHDLGVIIIIITNGTNKWL